MLDSSPPWNKFSLSKPLVFGGKMHGAILRARMHFIITYYELRERKKAIIMSTTHSLSNKKGKANDPPVIISFKDTCLNVCSPLRLACRKCIAKNEIATFLTRKGRQQKNNFRNTHENNKCEQKWSEKFAVIPNASHSRMKTHHGTRIYLGIEPKVDLVDGCFHSRCKSAPILQRSATPKLCSDKDSASCESDDDSSVSAVAENEENISSSKMSIANSTKPSTSFSKFDALVKHACDEREAMGKTKTTCAQRHSTQDKVLLK